VTDVHLFEPSGYAGVYQHAVRLGELLTEEGHTVVLHTGHEHEPIGARSVALCECSWWPHGNDRNALRSATIARRFVTQTLPHLRRSVSSRGLLHVQGIAAGGGLTLLTLAGARLAGCRVVYSPHDTFSRRGRLDHRLLDAALRLPQAVIVHSRADVAALRAAGVAAQCSPLVQLVPHPTADARQRWRERWCTDGEREVVLFAGFLRPEKRLDLLIESARTWPAGRKLAIVGEDRGAWASTASFLRRSGVAASVHIGFLELDDFAAALSAADIVVAPHGKASQSGVLSLARQLGTPTVAADVGGLSELASRTFAPGDVSSLTKAIELQLTDRAGGASPTIDEREAVAVHTRVYAEIAGE
jgi:glycosyltransferase involved in cell wall biosynthesis